MPLTITITLDDDQIASVVEAYNEEAAYPITADMIYQNEELKAQIAADMIDFWGEQIAEDGVYNLYESYFEDADITIHPGDPALNPPLEY